MVGDIVYGGEPIGKHEIEHPPLAAGHRHYLNFARSKDEGQQVEAKAHARDDLVMAHPALHAAYLSFRHPITAKQVTFTAPVHSPMRELVQELRNRPREGAVANEGCWVDLDSVL